jgi:hypothetical protein
LLSTDGDNTVTAINQQINNVTASLGTTTDAVATTDTGTFTVIALLKRLLVETDNVASIGATSDAAITSGNASVVSLLKGLISSIGTTSDTAATTDTQNTSLISLLKRLLSTDGDNTVTAINQQIGNVSAVLGTTTDAAATTDTGTATLISLIKKLLQETDNIASIGTTTDTAATTGTASLVALLKGVITSIGTTTDSSAATDTGTASLISLTKRLLTESNNIVSIGTISDAPIINLDSISFIDNWASIDYNANTTSLIGLLKILITLTQQSVSNRSMVFITNTITTATTTTVVSAPVPTGNRIYVSYIRVQLEGTAAQTVTIRDGANNVARFFLSSQGMQGEANLAQNREIRLSPNTALNIVSSAASTFNYTIGYFIAS